MWECEWRKLKQAREEGKGFVNGLHFVENSKFPVCHPEIISQLDHTDITKFFGLAKCTVLPPEKLFHPVLPMKLNGKLTFPLCAFCVEEEMTKSTLAQSYLQPY